MSRAYYKNLLISLLVVFFGRGQALAMSIENNNDLFKLDLPVVVINTVNNEQPSFEEIECPPGCWGVGITNVTKVPGRLRIILKNDTLYDSGEYIEKESGMTIKVRGNTSAFKDKKPYKVKLLKKADLLCRGDKSFNDKNWLLLRKEKLLWDVGFALNNLLQLQWTPSYKYVNLIINDEYMGTYMLVEAVNRNKNCRLNVDENGYVFEYDSYWWNEDLYVQSSTPSPMNYTFKYPESDEITDEQLLYFKNMINTVEQSVDNETYPDYIDVNSFASWILAQDILGNRSGGGSNVFLTKYDNTENSKVIMANLWDFDRIFLKKDSWSGCREVFLWAKLFGNQNTAFVDAYIAKWDQIKDWIFDSIISSLESFMNSPEGLALDESLLYEESIWNEQNGSIADNVEIAKEWFYSRKKWMEEKINQMRTSSIIWQIKDEPITDCSLYNLGGGNNI